MRHRLLTPAGALVAASVVLALSPAGAAAQAPRTADGHPDLQGVWNFSTATPMERPDDLAEQATLTAEEAAAWEQRLAERREANESEREDAPLGARLGYSVRIWFEHGHTLSNQRTSLVVDPPDGRIPPRCRWSRSGPRRGASCATGTPTDPRTAASRNAACWGSTRDRR